MFYTKGTLSLKEYIEISPYGYDRTGVIWNIFFRIVGLIVFLRWHDIWL